MDEQDRHAIFHGVNLETILTRLLRVHQWSGLYERVPVNCFLKSPSIKSSLTFLRKTPWARQKIENLYMYLKPEDRQA
ncbi:MAG: DUF2132 domain-containing protein [Candidatus Omnitrophica bacterium]|nr:DUF2132 domain-containing protein [Candidatus Omnitrophota bacterium]